MSVPQSNLGVIDSGIALALYNKFSQYLGRNTQEKTVIFYPQEVAQREWSEKQGKSVIDFISYFRNVTQFSWARNRTPVSRIGVPLNYTNSSMDSQIYTKAIPLDLTYEVIFWHHDLDIMNVLIENYFFWVHNNPTLGINIQNYPTSIYVNMTESPIDDMSTVRNMYQVGKYWVYKGTLRAEAWLPQFDLTGDSIKEIICTIWYKEAHLEKDIELGQIRIP